MSESQKLKQGYSVADSEFKKKIIERLKQIVEEKAAVLKNEIQMAIETRDNETKSSIGDDMDTDRTMAQYQMENSQAQLEKVKQLENEILKIDLNKTHDKVVFGSLVITSDENYFIFSAIGKIDVGEKSVYCISLSSPFGKQIFNKKEGEKIKLQNKEILITKIV